MQIYVTYTGHGILAQTIIPAKSADLKARHQPMAQLIPFYTSDWQISYRVYY